jgi:hypothetical protein
MKTIKFLSVSLAAGLAGVALVKLGSTSFFATLPSEKLLIAGVCVALAGLAAHDYTRRAKNLLLKVRVEPRPFLRPALPTDCVVTQPVRQVRRVSAIVEHTAA